MTDRTTPPDVLVPADIPPSGTGSAVPGPYDGRRRVLPIRLLTESELRDLPSPEWLIDGVLPARSLGVVHGPPASAKSFAVLSLALSITTGTPWFEREVSRGQVVYIAAEGVSGYAARIASWKAANAVAALDGFYLAPEPVQLLDPADVDRFLASLAAQRVRPALVVVDTLARSMVSGDENSTSDMGEVVGALQRIQMATGAAVLLVHHSRKSDAVERGSSALRGGADVMIAVAKSRDGLVTVRCDKMKEAPEFASFAARLTQYGTSCALTACSMGPAADDDGRDSASAMALLRLLPPTGLTSGVWRQAAERIGLRGGTFDRALADLRQSNAIVKLDPRGPYVPTAG